MLVPRNTRPFARIKAACIFITLCIKSTLLLHIYEYQCINMQFRAFPIRVYGISFPDKNQVQDF